jgi:MFS family permease
MGGRLADANGRKSVLVAALLRFGSFSIAAAMTSDLLELLLLPFVTGLGLGAAFRA